MWSTLLANASELLKPIRDTLVPTVYASEVPAKRDCKACVDKERMMPPTTEPSNQRSDSVAKRGEYRCKAYMHSQCPLNRRELGRVGWAYLHTLAAYYPDDPTPAQQSDMTQFVRAYARWYPCGYCADMTRDEMIRNPPQVKNQKEFSLWMCEIHNEVNDRMGKPIFDCSRVDERWKYGPADGSCN